MEENTRIGATLWVSAKLFEIIAVHKINTYKDFVENQLIFTICHHSDAYFYDPSDIQNLPSNVLRSSFMLELGIRLQEILLIITKGQVHEVLRHYMNEKGLLLGGGLE